MTDPAVEGVRRRWPRRVLFGFVALVLILFLLTISGVLPRALLLVALRAALPGRVEVGSVTYSGLPLWISRLDLYEPGDKHGAPAVSVKDLSLDYSERTGSYYLTLGRLDVDVQKAQRVLPKRKRPSKPARFNIQSLLPVDLKLESLNLQSVTPSYSFQTEGLAVEGRIASPQHLTVSLYGSDVRVALSTPNAFSRDVTGGRVAATVEASGSSNTVRILDVALPGLLNVAGTASIEGRKIDLSLEKLVVQDVDLSRADPADLPVPFAFKKVDMSGTRIQGDFLVNAFNIILPETEVRFSAEDLALGPQGAEYYQGDLAVDVRGAAREQADYTLTATLSRGQKVTATLKGHHLACAGQAKLAGWSRDDVLAALPANMRGGISYLPLLERVDSAEVNFQWNLPALKLDGAAAADFIVKGEKRPARLTFSGEGPVMPRPQVNFKINAEAELAGGKVAVASALTDKPPNTTLTLQNVDPGLWLYTLNERDMLSDLVSKISGTVVLEPGNAPQKVLATVGLKTSPFGYGPVVAPEDKSLSITGNLEADTGTSGYIKSTELNFVIDEDNQLILRNWNLPMDNFAMSADVDCRLNLSLLEHLLPGSDLRGQLVLQGPLSNDRGYMKLESAGTIEGLGYEDYAAPYGSTIDVKGVFLFDNLNGRLTGRNFTFALPEHTSLVSDGWTFSGSTTEFTMPFTLTTDFEPLEPMGLVDQLDGGSGSASGTLSYGPGGVQFEAKAQTAFDSLVAGGARAALTGAALDLTISKEPGAPLRGQGQLKAANVAAVGAVFEGVEGPVVLDAGRLMAKDLKGTLYGGSATADIDVDMFAENPAVKARAKVADVDLGLFTGTLQIPAVQMTGLAGGEADVSLTYPAGIDHLAASFESSKNFSVSAYLVEQLLAMQFTKQYASARQLEKVRAKIIGTEDQRPFDSGRMVLDYQGERIGGQAELKSKDLNLTVDLKMDTQALFSALELAQKARVQNLSVAREQDQKN